MTTCEDLRHNISLYLDGYLPDAVRAACDNHLATCPICRAELSHTRQLTREFANLSRPVTATDLAANINARLQIERGALRQIERETPVHFADRFRQWSNPRLMPYTVGVLASLLLFVTVLGALRPKFIALRVIGQASASEANALARTTARSFQTYDVTQPVSMVDYVASRTPYTPASPSLNPRGSLASLVWSERRDANFDAGDDDMIVVADVFSDGNASLAEVITPPRNRQMLHELENALRRDAAFVPAALDQRPRTMRVVFMFQKMDVHERSF